jgi:hypothetical protein
LGFVSSKYLAARAAAVATSAWYMVLPRWLSVRRRISSFVGVVVVIFWGTREKAVCVYVDVFVCEFV